MNAPRAFPPEFNFAAPVVLPLVGNGWAAIARMGGIGDNLIAAVALPGLKRKFGHVEVLSQDPQAVVFENNPHVDKLTRIDRQYVPQESNDAWQRWFKGRAKEFSAFYHLSHSCETLLALFPGQTQFQWPASYRRKMCGHNYLETVLDVCELPHEFGPSLFYPTDRERVRAADTKRKIGEKCIAWVISGTRLDKLHPYASMAVAQLVREVGPVVMLGAPGKDFELAKAIQEDVIRFNGSDRGLHLGLSADADRPTWPIRRVLSFVQACDVVVGPDTGPMWATAFEANAKVMLLSHASAENITKHWANTVTLHASPAHVPCWPCHQLHDKPDTCVPNREKTAAACISDISVPSIISTVSGLYR